MNDVYVGEILIKVPAEGINKASLATKMVKGKQVFSREAKIVDKENEQRHAVYKINITEVAFRANGGDSNTYMRWVTSLVADRLQLQSVKNVKYYEFEATSFIDCARNMGARG